MGRLEFNNSEGKAQISGEGGFGQSLSKWHLVLGWQWF